MIDKNNGGSSARTAAEWQEILDLIREKKKQQAEEARQKTDPWRDPRSIENDQMLGRLLDRLAAGRKEK